MVAAMASVVVAPFAGTLIVLSDCPLVLVARGTVVEGTPAMIWYDRLTLSVVGLDRFHE
jgi:hypothetical protein